MEFSHLLDEYIIDQRDGRGNAVLGDSKRGIDHEPGAHHGNMEGMGAPGGRIWHRSRPIHKGALRLAGAAV
jgi:hypothetical protein